MRKITLHIIVLVCLAFVFPVVAEVHDYAEDVGYQEPNASPPPGLTEGESTSRIDDYFNQDEQINITPDAGVVKVLRVNQKNLINDYVSAVVPVKNTHPRELRAPIRSVVFKEGGDANSIQDKVKQEYFMHVTCPRFQLPFVVDAIRALDESWVKDRHDGSGELYYQAKHRDINNIFLVTRYYRSSEGVYYIDDPNNAILANDSPAAIGLFQWGLEQADIPPNQVLLDVAIYEVTLDNDLKLGVDWEAWKNGPGRYLFELAAFASDVHGNLYFSDLCPDKTFIGDWDKRWYMHSFNGFVISNYLDFLQTKGKAKVLTHATMMARSGSTAEVTAVDQVLSFVTTPDDDLRFVTKTFTDRCGRSVHLTVPDNLIVVTDANGNPILTFESEAGAPVNRNAYMPLTYIYPEIMGDLAALQEIGYPSPFLTVHRRLLEYLRSGEVGIRAMVTPFIGTESMEVAVEVGLTSVSGYTPQGTPLIGFSYANSYVRLRDGEPFVLGGLRRTENVKRSGKVPFLGSLPVLGYLFGQEVGKKHEREILIVLKPRAMLSTQSVMEMPEEAQTLIAQVEEGAALPIPKNPFGFDMWLLDKGD